MARTFALLNFRVEIGAQFNDLAGKLGADLNGHQRPHRARCRDRFADDATRDRACLVEFATVGIGA